MKKIIFLFACLCLAFVGCEKSTQVIASFITETTSVGSENYGVKITYADDSRLTGKAVDTQIKFAKRGEVVIWQEGQDKFTFNIEDYDEWYSMTSIFSSVDEEKFELFDDVIAKSYFFNSDQSQEIVFRVVAGDIEKNSAGTGQILVSSEPISNQFTLKMAKK